MKPLLALILFVLFINSSQYSPTIIPTLPGTTTTIANPFVSNCTAALSMKRNTDATSLTTLTGNVNDVCIPGRKIDECRTWRMTNAVILKNADDLDNNVASILDYGNGTAGDCTSRSTVQWLFPRSEPTNPECNFIYNFNTISLRKAVSVFNTTRMLILDEYQNQTGYAMFVFMNKITECVTKNPPSTMDGAVLNIFTDMNLMDLCEFGLFVTQFPQQITKIRTAGYYIKFIFLTRQIHDQKIPDAAENILQGCNFNGDDSPCEILDSTRLDDTKSFQICMNDVPSSSSDGISLQLLLIIVIPSVSLTICCIGFFVCCLKCARLKLAFARLQAFGHDDDNSEVNHKKPRRFRFGRNGRLNRKLDAEAKKDKEEWPHASKNAYMDINALANANKKDVWEIESRNLLVQEDHLLGNGAFANVFKGIVKGKIPLFVVNNSLNLVVESENNGHFEAAVKKLPAHADDQNRVDFFHEIDFMKRLGHHSHVISMLGCVSNPYDPLIVVEYCSRGDLLKFLRRHKDYVLMNKNDDCPIEADMCLRIKDLVSITWQVADGLSYLASKNFIHRDLAARNVLLTKSLTAKISDFGLCRYMDSALYTAKGGRLPIKWMSIEALKQYEFSSKSDMWSYGVLLFEIFSMGDVPYPTVQPVEMLDHLEAGLRLGQPLKCPNEIYHIMQRCWDEKPENRPEANEIRSEITELLNLDDESYGYLNIESDAGAPRYTGLTMQEQGNVKNSRSYSTKLNEVKSQNKCTELNEKMTAKFGEEQATEIKKIICEVFPGKGELKKECDKSDSISTTSHSIVDETDSQ